MKKDPDLFLSHPFLLNFHTNILHFDTRQYYRLVFNHHQYDCFIIFYLVSYTATFFKC